METGSRENDRKGHFKGMFLMSQLPSTRLHLLQVPPPDRVAGGIFFFLLQKAVFLFFSTDV
jgi:hypothetical protein